MTPNKNGLGCSITTSNTALGIRMGLFAPMTDRPYSAFSSTSERNVRGAGIGPIVGTVIMLYTRLRVYPCANQTRAVKIDLV